MEDIARKLKYSESTPAPVCPKYFSVASCGPAAIHHPQAMGIYVRQDQEGYNNTPVYKKHLMDKFMFLAESGNWMMSSKLGGTVPSGSCGNRKNLLWKLNWMKGTHTADISEYSETIYLSGMNILKR